ncbi:hypothetical protein FDP41_008675 [Naegleria fowleri]|uniref:Uncharacterized protein n=1 Tax=Naegleria fowleri TaxID=5763 RepID=A0A6A5BET1_NAEFO|nr:uncharacterized protein FDP41_008675 [Naegleria fowleri]KAF0973011.1 hypothetical protein FDP41_008675 [Naegleria fowleri]
MRTTPPQGRNQKRLKLVRSKPVHLPTTQKIIRHRPKLQKELRFRNNNSGKYFNMDWALQSVWVGPSRQTRFIHLNKDKENQKNISIQSAPFTSKKSLYRNRPMLQNIKYNSLQRIDNMLHSYRIRALRVLKQQNQQQQQLGSASMEKGSALSKSSGAIPKPSLASVGGGSSSRINPKDVMKRIYVKKQKPMAVVGGPSSSRSSSGSGASASKSATVAPSVQVSGASKKK